MFRRNRIISCVVPAKAGTQGCKIAPVALDSRLRGNDDRKQGRIQSIGKRDG
jgi:hypothetical protein